MKLHQMQRLQVVPICSDPTCTLPSDLKHTHNRPALHYCGDNPSLPCPACQQAKQDGSSKFQAGQIVATPDALRALGASGQQPLTFVARHVNGDWGELSQKEIRENEVGLEQDWSLKSIYTLLNGERIWIITESDRSSTYILLPSEY